MSLRLFHPILQIRILSQKKKKVKEKEIRGNKRQVLG